MSDPTRPIEDLTERVRKLVTECANTTGITVTTKTQLVRDLGLDGDDADELMERYFTEFEVDPADFRFLDHFGWEAWVAYTPLVVGIRRLTSPTFDAAWRAAMARESDISVGHLALCAGTKRWVAPSIPPGPTPAWATATALIIEVLMLFPSAGVALFGIVIIAHGNFILGSALVCVASVFGLPHLVAATKYAREKTRDPSKIGD